MNLKKSVLFLLVLFSLIFIIADTPFTIPEWTIEGDSVYINTSQAYIIATPHDIRYPQYVYFNVTPKVYSGNVDITLGFNTSEARPTSIEFYNDIIYNETHSYTCEDYGNYTLNPRHFWCYDNQSILDVDNVTVIGSNLVLIKEGDFEWGNIPTNTIFWNETKRGRWQKLNGDIGIINYDFDTFDRWYFMTNLPVQQDEIHQIRVFVDINMTFERKSGKYGFAIKRSSDSISSAIANNHFYYLDPTWNATLNEGLMVYHKLDETPDTATAFNSVNIARFNISALNSTSQAQPSTNATIGGSYDFDGLMDYYVAPNNFYNVGMFANGITICSWVATGDGGGGGIGGGIYVIGGYIYLATQNNKYAFEVQGTGVTIKTTSAVEDQWHFICGTANSSHQTIYFDGNAEATGTATIALPAGRNVAMGGWSGATPKDFLDGKIDEVGIWNRSLQPQEIVQLYNGGSGITYTTDFTVNVSVITLNTPVDYYNSSSTSIIFNSTQEDNSNVTNASLYIDNVLNVTTNYLAGLNLTSFQVTVNNIGQGIHTWNVSYLDGEGNKQSSPARTFTVDSLGPNISFFYPLNTTYNVNVSNINYSVIDATSTLDRCWYSRDGGITNSSTVSARTNFTSVTSIQGGNQWFVYCNDSFGNIGSNNVSFYKDTVAPNVVINSPKNLTYRNPVIVNVTASDVSSSVSSCKYSFNSTTNNSLTFDGVNWIATVDNFNQGSNNLRVYCNDTFGNLNQTVNVSFFLAKNVSIKHFDIEIDDFIFDSDTYITIYNATLNLTRPQKLYYSGVGNVQKADNSATSTLYMRLTVNNLVIFNSAMRIVSGLSDIGVFNLPLNSSINPSGINNITIEVRNDGTGGLNISSLELHIDSNLSNANNGITFNDSIVNGNYSSITFVNVANFSLYKSGLNSTTTFDITHKFAKIGPLSAVVSCYVSNNITGERTPTYDRYISGTGSVGSSGISYKSSISSNSTEDWRVFCKSTTTDTILSNFSVHTFENADSNENVIPTFYNQTGNVIVTGEQRILSKRYTMVNDSRIEIFSTIILQSTTGAQDGSSSPIIKINSTQASELNCSDTYRRSLSSNDDIGTAKIGISCTNVTKGQTYDFNLYITASAGESITIRNATFFGYETDTMPIIEGIVAPLVSILDLDESVFLRDVLDVNVSINDISAIGWKNNISLLNRDLSFNKTLLLQTEFLNTSTYNFNTTNVTDGEYIFEWRVFNDGQSNFDRINITIDNTVPTLNITYPENSSYNSLSISLNYTFSEVNPDRCWYSTDSGITNSSTVSCGSNFTDTAVVGSNTWTVYINDTLGHENSTSVTFFIDLTPPVINITYPLNSTYFNVTLLNYTVDNTGISCWLTLDNGVTNYTTTAGTNFTGLNTTAGSNIAIVYCNDSLGNIGFNSTSFYNDQFAPVFTTFNNITHNVNTSLDTVFTVSDASSISSWYLNDTSVFSINSTGGLKNSSALSSINIYYLLLSVNDTYNNTVTSQFFVNVTAVVIPPTPPTGGGGGGSPVVSTIQLDDIVLNLSYDLFYDVSNRMNIYVYNSTDNLVDIDNITMSISTLNATKKELRRKSTGVYYIDFMILDSLQDSITFTVTASDNGKVLTERLTEQIQRLPVNEEIIEDIKVGSDKVLESIKENPVFYSLLLVVIMFVIVMILVIPRLKKKR